MPPDLRIGLITYSCSTAVSFVASHTHSTRHAASDGDSQVQGAGPVREDEDGFLVERELLQGAVCRAVARVCATNRRLGLVQLAHGPDTATRAHM